MKCPYPHCRLEELHDGQHDCRRGVRLLESGKLVFAIVGAAGYAGCLAAMHWLLGFLSLVLIAGTWAGVYQITEVE